MNTITSLKYSFQEASFDDPKIRFSEACFDKSLLLILLYIKRWVAGIKE